MKTASGSRAVAARCASVLSPPKFSQQPGGFLWGGRPRPLPGALVGLGLVPNQNRTGASGAVQGDRPTGIVKVRAGQNTRDAAMARRLGVLLLAAVSLLAQQKVTIFLRVPGSSLSGSLGFGNPHGQP